MKFSQLLTPDQVVLPLRASDKWDVIRQITACAIAAGRLGAEHQETVHEALVAREKSMTTGMENGIAIPHAAVDTVEDVVAVLGVAPEGVAFDTLDGRPATIIVGLIIPRSKKLLHIKTLAEIAKLLGNADVREKLLQAASPADAVDVLRAREREVA